VSPLSWSPKVARPRWWHRCVQGLEQRLTGEWSHPTVDPHHAAETLRCRDSSHLLLLDGVGCGARAVHRLTPVGDGTSGIANRQVFDDVDKPVLSIGVLIRDGRGLIEQDRAWSVDNLPAVQARNVVLALRSNPELATSRWARPAASLQRSLRNAVSEG